MTNIESSFQNSNRRILETLLAELKKR